MARTYFRVQSADRDVTRLLDLEECYTYTWDGNETRQYGISVCRDVDELVEYLATKGSGIDIGAGYWVVVELEGYVLDETGHDGEMLLEPSRIVSVTPFEDLDMYDRIGDAYDAAQSTY
jgi:hypothetical protein